MLGGVHTACSVYNENSPPAQLTEAERRPILSFVEKDRFDAYSRATRQGRFGRPDAGSSVLACFMCLLAFKRVDYIGYYFQGGNECEK